MNELTKVITNENDEQLVVLVNYIDHRSLEVKSSALKGGPVRPRPPTFFAI